MAINRFRIEAFLDEREFVYTSRFDDETGDSSYVLLFTGGAGVTVTLGEDGEYVLFRSLPLLTWEEVAEEHRVALLEHLLQRNNRLKVGHYSQSDEITFESSLVVEDGEVTDQQLDRCMGAVVSEVTNHGPKIRALAYGQEIEDSIDELIQRLIDDEDEA